MCVAARGSLELAVLNCYYIKVKCLFAFTLWPWQHTTAFMQHQQQWKTHPIAWLPLCVVKGSQSCSGCPGILLTFSQKTGQNEWVEVFDCLVLLKENKMIHTR